MLEWAPEVSFLARCQWCGRTARDVQRLDNGRTPLLLCELCAAQKEVLEQPSLRLEDLQRPPGLWDRLRRWLGMG